MKENLSERFKREIKKNGLTFSKVAEHCNVSKNTAVSWGKGAKIPASALAALMPYGFDVYYILAGRTQDEDQPIMLSPEKVDLVDTYDALSDGGRKRIRKEIDALLNYEIDNGIARYHCRKKPATPPAK